MRLELEAVGSKQAFGQELQCITLFGRFDRCVGRTLVGAGLIALGVHAAHVFPHQLGRPAQLTKAAEQHATLTHRVFTNARRAVLHTLPQLARQLQTLLVVGQRVVAQVEAVHQWVDAVVATAATRVSIVGIGQQWLGAARCNALKVGRFRGRAQRAVGVFNRPVVVRTYGGVVEAGLALTRHWQVVSVVIHYRAGNTVGFCVARILQLRAAHDGGTFEVVLQAQRMSDFMGDGVFDHALHEGLCLGAVGLQVAARFQQVECEVHL